LSGLILTDSSAWVEYDRATGSPVDQRMADLIADVGPLAVTEPVLVEVLAGARTDRREHDLRRLLLRFQFLPFDAVVDFDAAVRIYRRCRAVGVTPRGLVDCLIMSVALRRGAAVLAMDVDLERIASVTGVELDPASRQG
jgi:predicted nucleic acid-binding protein